MVAIAYNPKPAFKAVDGNQFTNVSRYFDADGDGKLNQKEMTRAADTLHYIGNIFGNNQINNMGDAFARLNYEVDQGNRDVDMDGDKTISYEYRGPALASLNWKPPVQELPTIIARNDSGKLEEADMQAKVKPGFKDVSADLARAVFSLFDKDKDQTMNVDEMNSASDTLRKIGKLIGSDAITNLADMFDRLSSEVKSGNRSVDQDGDGKIRYINEVQLATLGKANTDGLAFPPPRPNELTGMINRNNPNALEVKDTEPNIIYYLDTPPPAVQASTGTAAAANVVQP